MPDRNTGVGPFRVLKELSFDTGMAVIVDASDQPFAYVQMMDCVGRSKEAAKPERSGSPRR